MKKGLLIILALTILVSVIFAQDNLLPGRLNKAVSQRFPEKYRAPEATRADSCLYSFSVNPTTLLMSFYDYMIGGYNDLPLCVQPDPLYGGYFLTFHGKRTATGQRRVFYGYIDDSGAVQNLNEITNVQNWEGYPSIAVDPVSGKPLYAWHVQLQTANDPYDIQFAYDAFLSGAAGLMSDPTVIVNNPLSMPAPYNTTDEEYLWPTIQIGPSPTAGMRRAYVLNRNSTPHVSGVTVPSESAYIVYADFNGDMLELGSPLTWSTTSIPTLDAWNHATDNTFRRPNYGFTVGNDGKIYYVGYHSAGFVAPEGDIIEPELDAFVCDNYGAGTWQRIRGTGEYRSWGPQNNFGTGDPWMTQSDNTTPVPVDSVYISISDSAHLNAVMDDTTGKIHLLTNWAPFWHEGTIATELSAYYASDMQFIKELVFDTSTNTFSTTEVYPIAGTPTDNLLWLPWDENGDGVTDAYWDDDPTSTSYGMPKTVRLWPFPYWDRTVHTNAMFFHYGNTKITPPNAQGMMAAVWQDSNRSRYYNEYPADYPELAPYADAPEIWISCSPDRGITWSEPFSLNKVETPQFAGMKPMWVYPSDQVKYVTTTNEGRKVGKLALMFYDDISWGAYCIEGPVGQNDGGYVKFTELEITFPVAGPSANEDNIVTPELKMLKQNYPNPFNPETSIRFNMPKNGNANLSIYNTKGQLVKTLVNGNVSKGEQKLTWTGTDNNGSRVASGLYFYKLSADGKVETRKMMLMK